MPGLKGEAVEVYYLQGNNGISMLIFHEIQNLVYLLYSLSISSSLGKTVACVFSRQQPTTETIAHV